jgi:hypothetical protein
MVKQKRDKEIVINARYGGFGLSDEAFALYLKKKGIKYYRRKSEYPSIVGDDFCRVPFEKYEKVKNEGYKKDGNFKDINSKNWWLSYRDIERDDPILIEVIKELGAKANGMCAKLKIVKIPSNVDWEINEYDGLESVEEKHLVWR